MNDDSADYDVLDYTTQWTQLVEKQRNKPRNKTYSRRGSMNADSSVASRRNVVKMRRSSCTGSEGCQPFSFPSHASALPEQKSLEDRTEEEREWDRRLSSARASARNSPGVRSDTNNPMKDPPPIPPGRKIFRRANSVSDSSGISMPPPLLKRSQSVSTSSMSTSGLASFGAGGSNSIENFNPNFDPLEEKASPKRGNSCSVDGSIRGRKKSRPTSGRNFLSNDLSALSENAPSSLEGCLFNFSRGHDGLDSPKGYPICCHKSFGESRLLERGRSLPAFPSLWLDDVDEDEDAVSSSYVPCSIISPRKRRPSPLFLEDFDASPPPCQLTAKSRTSSPIHLQTSLELPTPLNEFQDRLNMFRGPSSSDDDTIMSHSHLSVSTANSEDDFTAGEYMQFGQNEVIYTERKILQPENASVDDVIKTMSSEEDVRFLVLAMNREKNQIAKSNMWQVALNTTWNPERRNALFRWATETLGFSFTSGGGDVSIMQIRTAKGEPLLALLKRTLEFLETPVEGLCKPRPEETLPLEFLVSSAPKSLLKTSQRSTILRFETKPNDLRIDIASESLLKGMTSLTMEERRQMMPPPTRMDVTFDNDIRKDDIYPVGSARPSLDHQTSSIDLMHHMHGTTPIRSKHYGNPPRLSIQSSASNVSMASPFPVMSFICDLVSTPKFDSLEECRDLCHNKGRDWGTSEPCNELVVCDMLEEFIRNCLDEGVEDSFCVLPSHGRSKSAFFDQIEFEASSQYPDTVCQSSPSSSSPNVTGMEIMEPNHGRVQFSVTWDQAAEAATTATTARDLLRYQKNIAKRRRTALLASAKDPVKALREARKSMFVGIPKQYPPTLLPDSSSEFYSRMTLLEKTKTCKHSTLEETSPLYDNNILERIFDFLQEKELLLTTSVVSRKWFEASTHSHANLMLLSVGCDRESSDFCSGFETEPSSKINHAQSLMERSWNYLTSTFPWACFLSEGAYKRVYKVFNHKFRVEEAISVMDVEKIRSTGNINVVGAELAVSVMLSSLVRRGVCPNFVSTRGVFCCPFEPPKTYWGSAENKKPRDVSHALQRQPKQPKQRGRYQYIRMELCDEGDAEEFLKRQPNGTVTPSQARHILFQISFALHAAAERFSLKHYDLKLLNVFLQRVTTQKSGEVVLRYGLGEHIFSLRAAQDEAVVAKLADYGTANVDSTSNGQNVTIAQFTTLENTPPDFMILGDHAQQGHGHDNFGLGLCMLHLFTGHAPYEEILGDVECPPNLKEELRKIWEDEGDVQYSVIRSIVLAGVFKDDVGHILEGEPDGVLYDTLYKFLVLFGVPDLSQKRLLDTKVLTVIKATLTLGTAGKKGKSGRRVRSDAQKFSSDRKTYSLSHGTNRYISRARDALLSLDGGMELLLSLVDFNPQNRVTALDVLNSSFMAPLREMEGYEYSQNDEVMSFTTLSTQRDII